MTIDKVENDEGALRRADIYRQYAMAMYEVNSFITDGWTPKSLLISAQRQVRLLGMIANNYLLNMAKGEGVNEINALIQKQKDFVDARPPQRTAAFSTKAETPEPNNTYDALRNDAQWVMKEYDRLCIKHRIFR
jgi:hypothetical protein